MSTEATERLLEAHRDFEQVIQLDSRAVDLAAEADNLQSVVVDTLPTMSVSGLAFCSGFMVAKQFILEARAELLVEKANQLAKAAGDYDIE